MKSLIPTDKIENMKNWRQLHDAPIFETDRDKLVSMDLGKDIVNEEPI